MSALVGGRPAPPGFHSGRFGPDLRFRVRYQDDGSFLELFFLQYQRPVLAPVLEACLGPGACFFDVGANIGVYSAWASRLVTDSGQVHAFEPIPATRRALGEILDYNELKNVHVEPSAVGEEVAHVEIWVPPGGSGRASAVLHNEGESVRVRMTTLDRYCAGPECLVPTLVKIDVEGLELQVLRGAERLLARPDAPVVVFEVNEEHGIGALVQIAPIFEEIGYRLFGLCPSGLRPIEDPRRGPLSLNTLALHPERHRHVLAKLERARFRRNQNT